MTEQSQAGQQYRKTVQAPDVLVNKAGQTLDGEVMEALLDGCVKLGASDIHMTVGEPPIYRRHGHLHDVEGYRDLDAQDLLAASVFFLGEDTGENRYWNDYHETGGSDIGHAFEDRGRFRISVFGQKRTLAIALRLIPTDILTFEQLGLPVDHVTELCHRQRGIVLLTGPTGCGKTTTIASMIDYINRERDVHIITIEDPIEYYHEGKQSIMNQREVGVDVMSFAEAVRRNMRSDPDVMLVGEMRDLETMRACLQAAETGHLVFSTLHTVSAPKTIDRLVTAFPAIEQEEIRAMTSTSLAAVFTEELIPRIDQEGRIAAYEIMVGEAGGSPAIGNLIRERKTSLMRAVIQSSGQSMGMQLMEAALARLVNEKKISFDDGYNRSNEKNDFLNFVDNSMMPEMYAQALQDVDGP